MDRTAFLQKIILTSAAVFAVLVFSPDLVAEQRWVTMTSYNDVRRMRQIHDSLYIATSGGLLVVGSPDEAGKKYTNLDGLGTVDLTDVIEDASGQIWISGLGRLIKWGDHTQDPYLFLDNDNNLIPLYCIADDGEFLWVGSSLGLILFSKSLSGGQIQDSYQLFGNLSAAPAVQDVLLIGDSIWVATSAGLAVADRRDHVKLKSPTAWTSFNISNHPEMGTSNMKRVVSFESSIYVATANGAYRVDRTPPDTTFELLTRGQGSSFSDLKVENDSLFLYYIDGLAAIKNGNIASLPISGMVAGPTTGASFGSARWVGDRTGGIFQNGSGAFTQYSFAGLPTNDVSQLSVDKNGVLTALFGRKGAYQLIDSSWVKRGVNVRDGSTALIADSSGNSWAGSFGNGLWRIASDTVKKFDQTNSSLRGNNDPNGASYVVIRGLATDGNYLFAACYRALNGQPAAVTELAHADEPGHWASFGIPDGIVDTLVSTLDFYPGNLVVGTEGNGLYWLYLGPDPFDKSDDSVRYLNKNTSFLRSDAVRVVKFAPDGTLWVGTNFGLSRYDAGIDFFVDVNLPAGVGPDITDIDFDTRGNIYISAHNGLARFDATAGTFEVFSALNGGLVTDDIRTISLDKQSGNLWIATGSGISLLTSAIAHPTAQLDSVFAFPNPYVVDSDADKLNFNYSRPGTVRIYDVSGALIAELPVNNSWNGKNQKGQAVASGVYLFVLAAENGNVGRGKFLLINKR
jgi:hypothetical protein